MEEGVAVGVASGVAAGAALVRRVGDAVAVKVALTTLPGVGVDRLDPSASRVVSAGGDGPVTPQAETTTALTIKATAQTIAGPNLRPVLELVTNLA